MKNGFNKTSMLMDLKYYANLYVVFIMEDNKFSPEINGFMSDLRLIDQSTIYPFLLPVFEDFDKNLIDESEIRKVLNFFIVYSVRRLITGVPSNSLRGFYKTLYNRIFKDQTHKSHYFDSILSFFMQLNTKDRVPTDDEFKNSLINGNLYQKKNLCKMLLTAIENNNSNETLDVKTLTIEHILPQTLNEVWLHELGENAEDIWSKYVHTLGNLTITGYNSELGQKSFNDKKSIIKNHSKANKLNESIISASNWSLEEIINRAMKLADRLLEIFHIDNAENVIDYEVNNGNSYSLIEKEKLVSTKPVSFTFMGDKFFVKSYKQMTKTMIENMYQIDDSILHKLAESNYSAFGTRCAITYDKNLLRTHQEIKDSGIFIESNLSTVYQLLFIEKILEEFGLD